MPRPEPDDGRRSLRLDRRGQTHHRCPDEHADSSNDDLHGFAFLGHVEAHCQRSTSHPGGVRSIGVRKDVSTGRPGEVAGHAGGHPFNPAVSPRARAFRRRDRTRRPSHSVRRRSTERSWRGSSCSWRSRIHPTVSRCGWSRSSDTAHHKRGWVADCRRRSPTRWGRRAFRFRLRLRPPILMPPVVPHGPSPVVARPLHW